MATRRRSSATKTVKSAPVIKESTVIVKKVTKPRAKRVNKVTPIAKSIVTETPVTPQIKVTPTEVSKVTEVTPTPQIEIKLPEGTNLKARPMNKETASKDSFNFSQLTRLRGLDFAILPLVYLEAFVVNILQNLDLKVPDRVAIK